MDRRRWRPDVALLAVLGLTLVLTIRLGVGVITTEGDQADARHYVAVGMTLAREGVFGFGPEPTMYREPLTSWTIAAQASVDPRLRNLDFEDVDRPGVAARAVKQQNLIWAALLLIGVGVLALRIQGGSGLRETAVALSAMVLTHIGFLEWEDVTDRSLSELAAGAILVWVSVFALRLVERPSQRVAVMLGVLLGLLALTKASFLYVTLVFLPILGFLMWRRRVASGPDVLRHVLIAFIGLSLVCVPWMARNQAQFGTFGISDRGGLALWFRVTWSEATAEELRGAWVYFSPLPLQPAAAGLLDVDVSDFEGEGALRRVARFAPTEEQEERSFYSLARRDRQRLNAEFRDAGLPSQQAAHEADRELMSRGVEALRADPLRFVRTTPVFLWRGTWSMLYSNLVPSILLGPLNLGGMALLAAALALSVAGMRPRTFAVVGVPGGLVAFYALLTHFEPRQSRPAAAVMILLCVLAGDRALQLLRRRRDVVLSR